MSAALVTLLPLIQSAILSAPDVIAAGMKAANLVRALFEAGLIKATEQNAVFEHINELCKAALTGQRPPELVVEPDPE